MVPSINIHEITSLNIVLMVDNFVRFYVEFETYKRLGIYPINGCGHTTGLNRD